MNEEKAEKIEKLNELLEELGCRPEVKDKVKSLLYEILEISYKKPMKRL